MKRRLRKRALGGAAALALTFAGVGAVDTAAFTLEGTVRDRLNGAPIRNATVTLVVARRSVTTDTTGAFSFGAYQVGDADQLLISHADYRAVRLPLGSLPAGDWSLAVTLLHEATGLGDEPESR